MGAEEDAFDNPLDGVHEYEFAPVAEIPAEVPAQRVAPVT